MKRLLRYRTLLYVTLSTVLFVLLCGSITARTYNVRNYGAKGDGKTNDLQAIKECLKAALEDFDPIVFFPDGTYLVSENIDVFLVNKGLTFKGGSTAKTIIRRSEMGSILTVRGYYSSPSTGRFTIVNIKLEGYIPASNKNQMINTPQFYNGLSVTDLRNVTISKVDVANIYGNGIYVNTTASTARDATARFQNVNITQSKVINCWGFHPKGDDYGDGIYLANVATANVTQNSIINDYNVTNHFGRAGLVVEYNASNCVLQNNTISGYDRGMHFEDDLGGHIIRGNKLLGSDLGLVFYSNATKAIQPVLVVNNYITNRGLPKKNALQRTRGVEQEDDRSLLNFYAPNGALNNSVVKDNIFEVDGGYDYSSRSVVNLHAPKLELRNNKYKVVNKSGLPKKMAFNNFYVNDILEEVFEGVDVLHIKGKGNEASSDLKRINRLNGATIELR